ncbi:uncharacterized protein EDB91DRAFT_1192322, partial [Suillus paluster]|uniref:uncharacterized protein n=1 Tax=Suillus paluster TaxID=48578 RepID=UPI001B861D67
MSSSFFSPACACKNVRIVCSTIAITIFSVGVAELYGPFVWTYSQHLLWYYSARSRRRSVPLIMSASTTTTNTGSCTTTAVS